MRLENKPQQFATLPFVPVEDPTNRPDYEIAAYKAMAPARQIVKDVAGGTPTMREAGTTYLPQEAKETPGNYNARKNRAVLFNAYRRVRNALIGLLTKKNPELGTDVPLEIKTHWENIDLAGSHADVFIRELLEDRFDGYAFILVDMKPALPPGSTKADEIALGRRPYWVKYTAAQAKNWRKGTIKGETVLTQITFEEETVEPKGLYGEESVWKYREFRLEDGVVNWALKKKVIGTNSAEPTFVEESSGTVNGFDRIPVVEVGEIGDGPPLLDLAYVNIAHYQELSDYREQLHALVPILVRVGVPEDQRDKLVVGPHSLVDVPTDCDLKYVSHDGQALEATRQGLVDTEQRMTRMGLSMMEAKGDAPETATKVRANNLQESSDLSTVARSAQDAIEEALGLHARHLGLTLKAGGSVKIGVAESGVVLDAGTLAQLNAMVDKGRLTVETLHSFLQDAYPSIELEDEILNLEKVNAFKGGLPQPNDLAKIRSGAEKILGAPGVQ